MKKQKLKHRNDSLLTSYKEFNNPFVAPQNSFNERNNIIPNYLDNPYLKPSNSAPPTIHPTPNVSREVSKDIISNESIYNKYFVEQKRIQTFFEEPGKELPRYMKSAQSINNRLQARLYSKPSDSDVLKTIKFNQNLSKNQTTKKIDTFYPRKTTFDNSLHHSKNGSKGIIPEDNFSRKNLLGRSKGHRKEIESASKSRHSLIAITAVEQSSNISLRQQYSEKTILEIIHTLHNRLNWPCDGILQGNVPADKEEEDGINDNYLNDDGEFVYCIYASTEDPISCYDIVYANPKKAQNIDPYFTVSASYVSKVSKKEGTVVTPVYDWLHERKMYNKICNIPAFKKFRIWKSFAIWKMILNQKKTSKSRVIVDKDCFMVIPQFQKALLEIQSLCTSLHMWKPTSSSFISLVTFDLNVTYTLEEFLKLQENHCANVTDIVRKTHEEISKIVCKACEDYYNVTMAQIDESITKIKNQELSQVVGEKVMRNYKNFQLIKEKYDIFEKPPPPDPLQILAEKKKSNFKHIRTAHVKNLHKKMCRFLRLIDFMFAEALRTIIVSSLNVLCTQINASSDQLKQVNLLEKCSWYGLPYEKYDVTTPLFYIELTLDEDEGEENGSSQLLCCLVPSINVHTNQFTNLLKQFELLYCCYKTLLWNDNLQKYVANKLTGEPEKTTGIYKNWPNTELVFGNDALYQKLKSDVIVKIVEQVNNVSAFSQNFLVFCDMISQSLPEDIENSLKQEWTSQQYFDVLKKYTDQVDKMNNMPVKHRSGMFLVNATKFKASCLPYPEQIVSIVNKHLPEMAVSKLEKLITIIKNGERELSKSIKSVDEFVVHLSFITKLADDVPFLEQEYTAICKLFSIAFEYSANFLPEEKALYQTLGPSFSQMKSLLMYCEAMKDENIQRFSHDLESIIEKLTKKLHSLSNQISNPSLIDEDMNSSTALETLAFLKEDLNELSESAKSFADYEVIFKSALSSSVKRRIFKDVPFQKSKSETKIEELQQEIAGMDKDLSLRCLLWESLDEWTELQKKWNETIFSTLDIVHLQKEVSRFVQAVYLLEKSLPTNTVVPALKKNIKSFQVNMPIISSLRNSALKNRHWQQITEITNIFFKDDRFFTLGKLIDLDLSQYQDDILEVSSQATNEGILEQMLNKVKEFWATTDFQLIVHSSRSVPIISGVDDILYAIDDGMVTITNIRGSRFAAPLQSQINEWDRKLSLFLKTFEEWVSLQRNWLYLENIFAAQDIQRQLPNEAKLFSQVDKNWRDIMRRTMDNPNALSCGTTAGLLEILQACNSNLEKIHRSLEEYLETKRLVFSRFYFLSNEELLDILANGKNVLAVQPYLLKCFANVKQLQFDFRQRSPLPILSMTSEEGEIVQFPKSLKARGQTEHWLANLESVIFDTIKLLIKSALSTYDDVNFISWITKQQGQISNVLQHVMFTSNMEEIFKQDENMLSTKFNQYFHALRHKLDGLASHVRGYMEEKLRKNAVSLIIAIVHQRDIVENLIQEKVISSFDYLWQRELRYAWDDRGNNVILNQSVASFTYGYEYLGCTSRLVITPLTDRCYLTLTTAMHFHLGGAPSGPAGTGKSETVKDLAKALGKHCLIFNCSEGLDFKMIGRYFSGLCQSGSWCCLDEFNRIDVEVLSVIAQQLHVIRSAKTSQSIRFMFEGKDIRLNPSSAVFITMNPGYAGRVDLPDNLKSMFRPISMVTPDNSQIAEIILFSNGFTFAAEFSRKIVNLYSLAKKQLSQQFHYDFGLRAIKALLVLAGERIRTQQINSSDSTKESSILIRAIQDSNFPKLVAHDAKLFQQVLEDIFPNAFKQRSESALLEKSIGISLRELSLQRCPSQIQKVIQFYETLNIRHGVMLVGPTAGGKTTVRNILQHALMCYEAGNKNKTPDEVKPNKAPTHTTVDMVTINPKSATLEDLYGKFDSNTAEWNDGLLSSTVRRMVNSNDRQKVSKEKSVYLSDKQQDLLNDNHCLMSTYQWLVLDGPVDTLWVENLNTVLDDSKLLCLANGERISLLPNMKIIFEVDSLQHASPATISRCGMIYLDSSELGWHPFVKRWLRNLRVYKVEEELRDHLWMLFESSVYNGFQFLKKYQTSVLVNVAELGIVQMLCHLLEGFITYISVNGGFETNITSDETAKASQAIPSHTGLEMENIFQNIGLSSFKKKNNNKFSFQTNKEQLCILFDKLYVFCYVWAFGGHFDCYSEEAEELDPNCHVPMFFQEKGMSIQNVFDDFVRSHFETKMGIALPVGSNLIYSYYVDIQKVQFLLWDHLMRTSSICSDNSPQNNQEENVDTIMDSFILTPTSICYGFLVSMLLVNHYPVLLTGVHGCGKTVLLQYILSQLTHTQKTIYDSSGILGKVLCPPRTNPIASVTSLTDIIPKGKLAQGDTVTSEKIISYRCEFSALTTVQKPKDFISTKLVKQSRGVLGPNSKEKIILFIDDVNMPQSDQFGTRAPLEVLRDYLDYGGFFDVKSLQWKKALGVTLLGGFTVSRNQNESRCNDRLLQKFSLLSLPQSSSQALHHIFHTKLSKHINRPDFTKEVCALRSDIISAILGVYHKVSMNLKTTPTRSHYMFNLRDVSKVVGGLLQASPSVIRSADRFIELAVHEMSRVFLDKLVSNADRDIFMDIALDQVQDFLKLRWSRSEFMSHQVYFGDFFEANVPREKRFYQCMNDASSLQQILEDCHDRHKLSSGNISDKLIFFPAICQHVVSVSRVLRQTNGHMLLLGVGGTGKKSVVRLACFLEYCEFVQPSHSKNYTQNDFSDDLKKVMLNAGVKGEKVAFFIDDRNIVKESFLELVSRALNATDLSGFFDNDAKESITIDLRSEAINNGIEDSIDAVYNFFLNRIKSNLHILFSTTPSGSKFHKRCLMYPALVNRCIVDWYENWPEAALYIVAKKYFEEKPDYSKKINENVIESIVHCHKKIEILCKEFLEKEKRHFHVTPKSFLDFLSLFSYIHEEKIKTSEFNQARLESGLRKLEETNVVVGQMKNELIELGPKLEEKTKETELLLSEISEDTEKVNKIRTLVKQEEEVTNKEAQRVESIANDAQKDLDNALPQLETATAALDALNKYDIGEIRSYAHPPTMVMTVLSAVCIALNEKTDWPTAKQLLADPGFLKRLISYDHHNVTDKIYAKLHKYTKQDDFNPLAVGKISVACKSMCTWVIALENYVTVDRLVKPKKQKCADAKKALKEARGKLQGKRQALCKIEEQLAALEERYQQQVNQLNELKANKQLTLLRLKRAAILIETLTSEKERWCDLLKDIKRKSSYVLTEALLCSSAISYLGPFTPVFRTEFINAIKEKVSSLKLPVENSFDFVMGMTEQVQVEAWMTNGLPRDQHSTQNAVIVENAKLWPYIIDPQRQALQWIKNKEKGNHVKVVNANASNMIAVLEDAIRLGEVIIIQNAGSTLDPSLDPILSKKLIRTGNQCVLLMGETEIQYNTKFRLYFLSNLKNPKLLPELCIKVSVVNFLITEKGLNEQVLSRVVQQEKPDLEMQRNHLLETLVQDRFHLTKLEDTSLNLLHKSKGNILDDEELISTLERSKSLASEIKIRVGQAEDTQKKLDIEREFYLPLAERGVLLYFMADELPMLSSMYQFSLSWFLDLFCKCIDIPKETDLLNNRPLSARGRLDEAKKFANSLGLSRRKMSLFFSMSNNSSSSRMELMMQLVTEIFYKSVSYALSAEHQLLFSFYLAVSVCKSHGQLSIKEYNVFLDSQRNLSAEIETSHCKQAEANISANKSINTRQWRLLSHLSTEIKCFVGLLNYVTKYNDFWNEFMSVEDPVMFAKNNKINSGDDASNEDFNFEDLSEFNWLMLINILRPDCLTKYVMTFIETSLSPTYVTPPGFDLENVFADSTCRTPIMFILSPGSDPSSQLTRFVKEIRGSTLHLDMMSLGRLQGQKAVDAIRKSYSQRGSWVFLQNCHLALSFMTQLEEIVSEISDPETQVHPQFRLWLSTRPDVNLPIAILQNSLKVSVEPPPGIRSLMKNAFTSVGGIICESFFENTNVHRNWKELVYSACLFHSIVHERQKFRSRGWNISYDFIMADLEMALLTLRDMVSQYDVIPWNGLRSLTGNIIYGGRVTDPIDLRCLVVLLEKFYSDDILQNNFSYMNTGMYSPPSSTDTYHDVVNLIEHIPGDEKAADIFGMDISAAYECNREQAFQLVQDLMSMRSEQLKSKSAYSIDQMVINRAKEILSMLPNEINLTLHKTKSSVKESGKSRPTEINMKQNTRTGNTDRVQTNSENNDENDILQDCAIFTTLSQEAERYNRLLRVLRNSLSGICDALKGDTLMNENFDEISQALLNNNIPLYWKKYSYKSCKNLSSWLDNLKKRVTFISRWFHLKIIQHETDHSPRLRAIWLPAFFYPQGILTAILQNHSRMLGKSVDQFCFDFRVTGKAWQAFDISSDHNVQPIEIAFQNNEIDETEKGFRIFGLFIDGASWDTENDVITKCSMGNRVSPLPEIHFVPVEKIVTSPDNDVRLYYECPLYQTSIRRNDMYTMFDNFVINVNLPTSLPPEEWVLGGVAAVCQTDY